MIILGGLLGCAASGVLIWIWWRGWVMGKSPHSQDHELCVCERGRADYEVGIDEEGEPVYVCRDCYIEKRERDRDR